MHDERGIDTRAGKQLNLLVAIGEQLRGRLWSHNRSRMLVKGNDYALTAQSLCFGLYMSNYCTMTLVYSVVCANRDNRPLRVHSNRVGIAKNKHEYLRYRFGQNH